MIGHPCDIKRTNWKYSFKHSNYHISLDRSSRETTKLRLIAFLNSPLERFDQSVKANVQSEIHPGDDVTHPALLVKTLFGEVSTPSHKHAWTFTWDNLVTFNLYLLLLQLCLMEKIKIALPWVNTLEGSHVKSRHSEQMLLSMSVLQKIAIYSTSAFIVESFELIDKWWYMTLVYTGCHLREQCFSTVGRRDYGRNRWKRMSISAFGEFGDAFCIQTDFCRTITASNVSY